MKYDISERDATTTRLAPECRRAGTRWITALQMSADHPTGVVLDAPDGGPPRNRKLQYRPFCRPRSWRRH